MAALILTVFMGFITLYILPKVNQLIEERTIDKQSWMPSYPLKHSGITRPTISGSTLYKEPW